MHEVRVTVPAGKGAEVARIALKTGIHQVSVYTVYVYGPETAKETVSAETSTPDADRFVDALFKSGCLDRKDCIVTTRQLRAIWSREGDREITNPMQEPELDVIDDLWQLSYVTASYIGRAAAAAVLLAYALLKDDPVALVAGALFLPFFSPTIAAGFGIAMRNWGLARQGAAALAFSAALCVAAGAGVAALSAGAAHVRFRSAAASFAISCAIGAASGLSIGDDTGRRYMIGVAAAVQYAIYPVWFGIALVRGLPDWSTTLAWVGVFFMNVAVIGGGAACVYALRHWWTSRPPRRT